MRLSHPCVAVPLIVAASLQLESCGGKESRSTAPPPPPQPTKLAFITTSISAQSGAALSPAIQVVIQDAGGSTVAGAANSVTIAITAGTGANGATLSGTLTLPAVNGVASFGGVSIDKAGSGYTLTASATSLASATSSAFSVSPGPPAKLEFSAQPAAAASLTAIAPAIQVVVQDAVGNTTTGTTAVTLALTSGSGSAGAVLGGTVTQAAVNGVATFTDLTVDKVGGGYTLTASASGLPAVTSAAFRVDPGAAHKLAFATQPTTVTSMAAMNPSVQVLVQDTAGNTVTGSNATIALAITSGSGVVGATLGGLVSQAAVSGVGAFGTLTIDKAGSNYTLTATSASLVNAVSAPFSVSVGAATRLAFGTQPAGTAQGASITPAVQVTVQDAGGNTVTSSAASIAVAVTPGSGTAGAVMGGTLTKTAVSGAAAFADLTIDRPGSGYTLTASSTGLATAVSSAFTVNGGTISGTITLVSTFLSLASAPGDALALAPKPMIRGAPGIASLQLRAKASPINRIARAPAPATRETRLQPEFAQDELIVTFKPSESLRLPAVRAMSALSLRGMNTAMRDRARGLAEANGAKLTGSLPAIRAVRVKVDDPSRILSIRAALARDPSVAAVERNALAYSFAMPRSPREVRIPPFAALRAARCARNDRGVCAGLLPWRAAPLPSGQLTPSDPFYPAQAWHYLMIDMDYAWSITTGSSAVIVAVVDDGIRFDHPDIAANLTSDGYDFVSSFVAPLCAGGSVDLAGDGNGPDPDPTKPNHFTKHPTLSCYLPSTAIANHGLHVAGTIGAVGGNGLGVTGVNWAVKIRPVRVLNSSGSGSSFDIAQGILYAAGLPVDIGSGTIVQASTPARIINLSLGGPVNTLDEQNAVAAATANGALVVAAAGNSTSSAPFYPAAYPEVISVSAVGPDATIASYSNFGSTVDIAAPGGDQADGNSSYGVGSTAWDFGLNAPEYEYMQGTSMAAPHVSGVAALLFAQSPSLTAAQVRARLESYAVDLGAAGRDDLYGAGLINARNSLTQTFGTSHATRARLYSQTTGALAANAPVAPNGSYTFTQVPSGMYWVYGAQDEDGDGQFGLPRRRWSAFGGTPTPTSVSITGTASQSASFSLGFAFEKEPNDITANADVLVVGGHLLGFASSDDGDISTVLIPSAGQYTFETSAFHGACGFALELDTVLGLYDANGTLVASNDDIDFDALDVCSRIVATLAPGRYYLRVSGYDTTPRRYYLKARRN